MTTDWIKRLIQTSILFGILCPKAVLAEPKLLQSKGPGSGATFLPREKFEITFYAESAVAPTDLIAKSLDTIQTNGMDVLSVSLSGKSSYQDNKNVTRYAVNLSLETNETGKASLAPVILRVMNAAGVEQTFESPALNFQIVPWYKKYRPAVFASLLFSLLLIFGVKRF